MTPLDVLHWAFPRADSGREVTELVLGFLLVAIFLAAARLAVRHTGHPIGRLGRVVYVDDGLHPTLRHPQFAFSGRPDFVVAVATLWGTELRPVEYKSGRPPRQPYANHVWQLAGNALLVEALGGTFPRFGYLVYGDERIRKVRLGHKARYEVVQAIRGDSSPGPVRDFPATCRFGRSRPVSLVRWRQRRPTHPG